VGPRTSGSRPLQYSRCTAAANPSLRHWSQPTNRRSKSRPLEQAAFYQSAYRCLHRRAPQCLADHLIPASDAAPRRRCLQSANRNCLTVPRCRLSTYGCRAFHYAGPPVWNSLPDERTCWIVLIGSSKQFSLAATVATSVTI